MVSLLDWNEAVVTAGRDFACSRETKAPFQTQKPPGLGGVRRRATVPPLAPTFPCARPLPKRATGRADKTKGGGSCISIFRAGFIRVVSVTAFAGGARSSRLVLAGKAQNEGRHANERGQGPTRGTPAFPTGERGKDGDAARRERRAIRHPSAIAVLLN